MDADAAWRAACLPEDTGELSADEAAALLAVVRHGDQPETIRRVRPDAMRRLTERGFIRATGESGQVEVHPDVLFSLGMITPERYQHLVER